MLSLSFVDALTPGDLTGGTVVAGTGTSGSDGQVGPIAGIELKVVGAHRAGAQVFFAPEAEADRARDAAPQGLTVVSVATAAEALRWLCGHGGQSTACSYYPPTR
jgi:PDZ domain-containing protein